MMQNSMIQKWLTEQFQQWATPMKAVLRRHALILGVIIASLWLIELLDLITPGGTLDIYGIQPRTWHGLRNILFAPLLHAGFGHLLANTIPLIVLGWLVMLRGEQEFAVVTLAGVIVSGLGVWLLGGANTIHLGASGVIFAYMGYLLTRGLRERSLQSIAFAVIAFLLYGGMIRGVLPGQDGVSWLAHMFGFLGGGLAAYLPTKVRTGSQASLMS